MIGYPSHQHLCRATRHTHREGCEGGQQGGGGDEKRHRPRPPDLPRAPRKHQQGTAPAKAVVARSAAHQPRG